MQRVKPLIQPKIITTLKDKQEEAKRKKDNKGKKKG